MEAASRPPVEPLPELPVEQPAEGAVPVVQAANPEALSPEAASQRLPSPEAAKEAPPPAAPDAGATQTVEFLNPDLLLAGEEAPAAAASGTTLAAVQALEVDPDAPLALEEDTLDVEKILSASAPPPPPSSAPAPASAAAWAAAPAARAASARSALAPEEPLTLVPDSGSSSDSAKPSPPAPKAASAAPKPDTRNTDSDGPDHTAVSSLRGTLRTKFTRHARSARWA